MAIFFNQATLSYGGTVTDSNITAGEVVGALEISKSALSAAYSRGEDLAYAISITNTSDVTTGGITLTDDLGAYTLGTATYRPLDYIEGSVRLYIGGVLTAPPTVTVGKTLTFSDITIPQNTSALIIYQASVNDTAPLALGTQITNTATLSGGCEELAASATVPARAETSLTIAKAMCPGTVSCGGEIIYTFIIQNTGNAEAGAEEGVSVRDVFQPTLSDVSLTLNGESLPATSYTYNETTGELVTAPGAITVPAATYTQNSETGAVTLTPGVAIITVTGTV